MKTIYKYNLAPLQTTVLNMPQGSNVVAFDIQGDSFCIWAIVNTDNPIVERTFTIVGTGWELKGNECYIGMVQQNGFVWHCLELKGA